MPVPMMDVGVMHVFMNHGFVLVWVRMGLNSVPCKIVHVLMVLVMRMGVRVFNVFVGMLMFVPFGEMQPNTETHQRRGNA